MRVAVLGGGSFGTVLAHLAAANAHDVRLWMRDAEQCQSMRESHENLKYMPGYPLDGRLVYSANLSESVERADLVFCAVPGKAVRSLAHELKNIMGSSTGVISTTKGIEVGTFALMSQILRKELGDRPIGVLSGPNLAREIMAGSLSGTVIASSDEHLRHDVIQVLASTRFRVFANSDVYGVELAGALKNIYAIASGMASCLAAGENTRSMLMTRALAEMSRFAVHLGANPLTFLGLAGVGDLIATCSSSLSRNFQVGVALAQGKTLDQIIGDLEQTAEGINTIRATKEKSDELGIYMPIVQGLYALVFEQRPVAEVIRGLMTGVPSADVEYTLKV